MVIPQGQHKVFDVLDETTNYDVVLRQLGILHGIEDDVLLQNLLGCCLAHVEEFAFHLLNPIYKVVIILSIEVGLDHGLCRRRQARA